MEEVAVKIIDLSKKYKFKQNQSDIDGNQVIVALDNINLEIKKGESVGIIGANGSGKSTLLKILAGVTPPTQGKVEVLGRVASILEIGAGFHPELTGIENVFLNGQLLGFSEREISNKLDAIIEFSGIEKFVKEPVKNYSNGMYLRLAFSIIANLEFDVYLLDEVMSVGDAAFQFKVNQFLQNQKINRKATFIFVSHDLQSLNTICDYCYLFENGKIVNKGSQTLIDNYLSKAYEGVSDLELPENTANLSAENEFLVVDSIQVKQGETYNLHEDLPFLINCIFRLKKEAKVDIAFGIQNLLSQDLCYSSTLLFERTENVQMFNYNEVVLSSVTIPKFTLKPGTYILTISVVIDEHEIVVPQIKVLVFKIKKSKNKLSMLVDNRPAVAHIKSEWSFKNVQ